MFPSSAIEQKTYCPVLVESLLLKLTEQETHYVHFSWNCLLVATLLQFLKCFYKMLGFLEPKLPGDINCILLLLEVLLVYCPLWCGIFLCVYLYFKICCA